MQPNLDVRRHNDGSIDFDFYRRRATRRRRLARRVAFKRGLTWLAGAPAAGLSLVARTAIDCWQRPSFQFAARACAVGALVIAILVFQASAQAPSGHHGAAAHIMVSPSELKWADVPSLPPGAQIAVIEGPLNAAVPFTMWIKMPANYKIPPHWHPAIEHLTVLTGTFHMGMGDKLDTGKTRALTPGSIAIMQPRTNHFAWTSEETIVQLHGVGPWGVTYVDPADDPRKQ